MAFDPLTALLEVGKTLIDRIIPDKIEADKAKANLLELEQSGDLKELQTRLSAIISESQSLDPWTSRARPTFLYVMYTMILAAIPMGVLYAFDPILAKNISTGMKEWLADIPNALYGLFGAGYLGYSHYRSVDKKK